MADSTEAAPQIDNAAKIEETAPVDAPVDAPADAPETENGAEEKDEDIHSKKGTALYAHKNYEEAAEIFSLASILQAEINGETAPENAEILFHYGRSLFKVGQSKSDVLGGSAPVVEKKPAKTSDKPKPAEKPAKTEEQGEKAGEDKEEDPAKKPLFQFTGDENFDDSDEEEEEEEGEPEEEDDDLATAFEILDLARVCYIKLLEQVDEEEKPEGKGKETAEDSPKVRHIKERLADTHDALAEISLENERYPNAIEDGRTSLKYKLELYPEDSEIIAEAHYKLSLALEFASITTTSENGGTERREEMDQGLRAEAAKEMELAIQSSKLKTQNKEVELATMASPEDNELARKQIAEMKELIADMEQRLVDLRNDPIDTKGLLGADANPLAVFWTKARIDEASKTATDLSGLVRKKKTKEEEAAPADVSSETESNGKRKAEDDADEDDSAKRAKVEASEAA
uniref:Tetratricopeptide SHNi-TPR domain-containing protein n=1 Tax=Bionectria ochroleuca TaxID=29856 RepID=A0A8H7K7T9_BIOOC